MSPSVSRLQLERWAIAAWPALEEIAYDGWILRFADGHTKRSNCVNPLRESTAELDEKIAICERAYAERGLPTVFRLTPFSEPSSLDDALADLGYEAIDRTWVMTRPLGDLPTLGSIDGVESVDLASWLDAFERLGVLPPDEMAVRREILSRIPSETIPLAAGPTDRPAGVNLGVHDGEAVGLFSLYVAPERRREGVGRALVEKALQIAADRGAAIAYLQVEATNGPARALYAKLGFFDAYPYWYRVRRDEPETSGPTSAKGTDLDYRPGGL